ncbi:MAG: bifunctional phosphopantothenoylcysteine decarboxylase/phosphopantothenate--cysteine ligase CoaBC [Acidobacteria bacterium]|nr:bifunctional phosphopantothenoylcysteine decarboxylase/phosphopantothenate--cysteine ligase CoaBC [Acidobacteriota bacterium]
MFIALGITGCIGAYKSIELIRRLQQDGHEVQAVLTRHGAEFVTPLVVEAISRHPVITDMFQRAGQWEVEHITLARRAQVLCVSPATANIMAKFAHGIADDFLTTLYLSNRNPVVIAPAMNTAMWEHPATRRNLDILQERGATMVTPDSGYLACGEEGAGRLADLEQIVESIYTVTTPSSLKGRTVLVTAGPTAEDIDPVRFISNRSSGRMGFALARVAARRGARTLLVTGPVAGRPFHSDQVRQVRSAAEMSAAVLEWAPAADVIIMAAAVADYRPRQARTTKIKKTEGATVLELVRTADILLQLKAARRPSQIVVGFAAETDDIAANARRKMEAKGTHLMVANRVGADVGFGDSPTTFTLFRHDATPRQIEGKSKEEAAAVILDEVERLLTADSTTTP